MTLVFLDTETTGLNPDRNAVWEIAYAVEDEEIRSSLVFHSFFAEVDPEASKINGYDDRYVMPNPRETLPFELALQRKLKGATLVASNPSFDTAFLRARWGVEPWHHRKIDISTYALPLYGEMLGLYKIAERLDIEAPDHTAAQDVATLRACYRALEVIYSQFREDQ